MRDEFREVEAMRRLRETGVKTAIVSNKADYAVQKLCETWFGGLCDLAVGERDGMRKKPAPDMDSVWNALSFDSLSHPVPKSDSCRPSGASSKSLIS